MRGKNLAYKFAYAVFKNRENLWFSFLENAPEGLFCNLECGTYEHLFFCPTLQPSRNISQVDNSPGIL